ncbi:MAG: RecX family transcriptional regulator [bacterium]|nr:RecX family transcriptional regulator [Candidatus Kapabacteria bacterium]
MDHLDITAIVPDSPPAAQRLIITDVQTQRKRAERRSIFVNDEFAFGVSEECYVKYALFKGREVTQHFLDEVMSAEELYQARQCAMRMLGRRMRSVHEIRTKLAEKEFPGETIDATLEFLRSYGMIDDDAFARAFVSDQLMRRPVGRRKLEQDLRTKGIAKDAAGELVLALVDDDCELSNAIAAAEKKFPLLRQGDAMKRDRALASFLAGRGFSWNVIANVVKQFHSRSLDLNSRDR